MLLALYLLAHSWYPPECCSDRDCEPVRPGEVQVVPGGYQYKGRFVPESKVRPGPDMNFHVCFWPQGHLICFFKPATGV